LASPRQNPNNGIRLQKYLASCGLGSRRHCEDLIVAGRVTLNGETVTRQGLCVEPSRDSIRVDGRPCRPQGLRYLMLNKPVGYLCTNRDPQGRRTYLSLLPPSRERLFSIGRLDADSSGLLLVTNDGELAMRLAHPRHWVAKTYEVIVNGRLTAVQADAMRRGILVEGETLRAAGVELLGSTAKVGEYRIVLREGRKRQIRRMFAALGLRVIALHRTAVGSLRLEGLPSGQWRDLDPREIEDLKKEAPA
jgi:pseudouridine synthase